MHVRTVKEGSSKREKPFYNRQDFLAIFLFNFLLCSYPLVTFLWRRSYSIFTAEVGLLLLFLAVFSILLVFVIVKVRPVIGYLMTSILVTVTFLIQFNLLMGSMLICVVVSLTIAWKVKTKIYLYSLPVLFALYLGAILDSRVDAGNIQPVESSENANSELPPIFHIILDGFVGLDGLPAYPISAILKKETYGFFSDFGFQVFPQAYSRYSATVDSLHSAFNFQNSDESKYSLEVLGRREHILKPNAQFDVLEKLGYRFNIYQSSHLDYCKSNPGNLDRCWEYDQPNIHTLKEIENTQTRAIMLANVLLNQSVILSGVLSSQGWLPDLGIAVHDPGVFTMLERDAANEPDGRFFFAHVLLPHAPFIYTHNCAINYESDLRLRYPIIKDEPVQPDAVYEFRTGMYFEQMECALKNLRQLFEDMKREGIFERSIVVIHGDHGSMISKHEPRPWNIDQLSPADYRSQFSTLFAVKFPDSRFSIDQRALPLSSIFEGFSKAVEGHIAGERSDQAVSDAISDDPEKIANFVYLLGPVSLQKVEINIFED